MSNAAETRAARLASVKTAALAAGGDLASWAAEALAKRSDALVRGAEPVETIQSFTLLCHWADWYTAAELAWTALATLAGSLDAFNALAPARKANLIRYAVAALGSATETWSPDGVVGHERIGRNVWAEVMAA